MLQTFIYIVHTFIYIVHLFVCLVLMGVVLLQQGKGGGMGAAFGGASTQVFGGRGAGNLLTRTTAICAGIFMFTSVSLAHISSSSDRALKAKVTQEAGAKVTQEAGRKKDKGQLKERAKPAESAAPSPSGSAGGAPTSPAP